MSVVNVVTGALTHEGVTIAVAVAGAGDVRIAVDTDPALAAATYFGPVTPDADGYALVSVTGLAAGTRYHFAAEHAAVLDVAFPGQFKTLPAPAGQAFDFSFWASSCAGLSPDTPGVGDVLAASRLSNHAVFDQIRTRALSDDVAFGIHAGDLSYYDLGSGSHGIVGGGSLDNYRRMLNDVLLQPRQHQLYRDVPLVYVPDDHDRGPNNHDRTYADGVNFESVYRQRIPSYALEESSGAVYHSWQVGRVLFIAADVRSARDPNTDPDFPDKTLLGTAQHAWMDTVLSTSSAEMLCWIVPSQWLGDSGDGFPGFSYEQDLVISIFAAPGGDPTKSWLPRMFAVSGDQHAHGMATGIGNPFGGFPWFQFSSLDSTPSSAVTWFNLGSRPGRGQYGVVSIRDLGHTIAVTGTAYSGTDAVMSHTFNTYLETPAVALDYAAGHISEPFEPVDDDQSTRNDITVDRPGGSSVQLTDMTGPLNVQDPPDGVGRYDTSATINVESDSQLGNQAGWRLHQGTVDEARYPTVRVDLARNTGLVAEMATLDVGDALTIANPPAWLPQGRIEQLAQGFTETFDLSRVDITTNCAPAAPWRTGSYDTNRYDTAGSQLDASVDATATALSVATTLGPVWISEPAGLYLDGTTGTYASTSGLNVSGDLDLRCGFVMGGWPPANDARLLAKFGVTGDECSWQLRLLTNGNLNLVWSANGSPVGAPGRSSTVALPVTPGVFIAVKATLDVDDGLGNHVVTFYTSTDFVTWTQLGDPVTTVGTTSVFASSTPVSVGARTAPEGDRYTGWITRAEYRDGIDGTLLADPDFAAQALGATTFTDGAGNLWTLGGNATIGRDMPFDVLVGGERMTVTAVDDATSPQAFTVVRSVNGITKSHASGTAVALADPCVYAL